ncbi:acetyl ornithine aminotransferase family protein [Candidatus Sumerlaeota bacterium]|nr:acetyl ornithine aminotransferase family protein [Candidatus Sumerlaeota bacterium]
MERKPMYPKIKTSLPGPIARKIIQKDEKYMSPSYTRDYPFVMDHGKGCFVTDVDGNVFLDFAAGIAVCATGHSHPNVVKAIRDQAGRFLHMSGTDFYYDIQVRLAEELSKALPLKGRKRVFFTNSGAEAIEAAMKLARYHTMRHQFIAFFNAFHGRTLGALSLTGSKIIQKKGFYPLVPGVVHVPYAYCYRCPYNLKYDSCCLYCLKYIEDMLFLKTVDPDDVAAIFVEPIQGEGGYVVPPVEFMVGLRRICDRYGILLVCDEVQSGMGRTGRMFAVEHFGVEPDIVCLAKGIASGMPLGAIIASAEVMTWQYGSHASTFGGNPVSCAAALATVDLLNKKLMKNAEKMGAYIKKRLTSFIDKYQCVGDVRGIGLMIGVEIIKNKKSMEMAPDIRNRIINQCFKNGLLILGCGPNTIRIAPPLIVNKKEADIAIDILEKVIARERR